MKSLTYTRIEAMQTANCSTIFYFILEINKGLKLWKIPLHEMQLIFITSSSETVYDSNVNDTVVLS